MFVKIAFEGKEEPYPYGDVELDQLPALVQVFGTNYTEDAEGQQYEFVEALIEETPTGNFRLVIYLKKVEEPIDISRLKFVLGDQTIP